ncbi:MerR family transcriptional regulator [Glycomyces luteolus]|uniref:MerR family transcriptional regulator n=1 Tax=Glycomyces luteolus TaxID=2670330 RepID=A0A9X3P9J2_9ACTN|nr:MerR family transcriptional regulator [Glycomyces luteolus]MDA1361308.1 MerR family transcriptional regulator [Glycomyces luteolus]
MLIGELSRRTGVSTRLLRYYEEQQLLLPGRDSHGYRSYPEDAPARVEQIRELLEAGVSTREIRHLIPCHTKDGMRHCDHSATVMRGALERLNDQIADLNRKRGLLANQAEAVVERPYDPVGPRPA